MALLKAVKQHRKFQIIHDIEKLYNALTEISTPEGIFTEMLINHNGFNYVVRIDTIRFLTEVEYQFRLGSYNKKLDVAEMLIIDTDDWTSFLIKLFDVL